MAINPINVARTSFNLQSISLLDSLRRNTLDLFLQQNRLGTGNRLNAPSEDPVLAGKATTLTEMLERQQQVLANIEHADTFLSVTDNSIGEISGLLTDAHNIALEMVNTTSSQAQRDSMAELVKGILNQLVTVGNRTYMGVYLFGGQDTTMPPFTQDNGGVEYRGDDNALRTHVDLFQDPQINLNGHDVFGALAGEMQGYVDLNPTLETDTRLADMAGFADKGITKGTIRISLDSPSAVFSVDLGGADTIGDVVDLINQSAEDAGLTVGPGNQFNAALNGSQNGLDLTVSSGTVTVEDLGEGVTARDLGIRGSAAGTLLGGDLNPYVTETTKISSLFGGAGAALGGLRIENGSLNEVIDLSGLTTIEQVLNRINKAGVEVNAHINDSKTGIDVTNLMSGMEMKISETGGNTAETLGIRTLHGQTQLDDLNDGQGVNIYEDHDDLVVTARDGSSFNVRLDGASTVQDVIDMINGAAGTAGVAVTASLAVDGNGIRLVDTTGGGGDFSVQRAAGSAAIDGLGLEQTVSGNEIVGNDVNGIRPNSVFTALIQLHDALVAGGPDAERNIGVAAERLETFIEQTARTQGVVGARSRAMSVRLDLTEQAVLATEKLLSQVKDLDYTEAITQFQQTQTILQANLMTGSQLLQLSLLDFI